MVGAQDPGARVRPVSDKGPKEGKQDKRDRLIDLDGRLQGILDHLTQKDASSSTPVTLDYSESSSTGRSRTATSHTSEDRTSAELLGVSPLSGDSPPTHDHNASPPTSPEWMYRIALDHDLVDHLLQRFRAMQHYFPFVVIPSEWTARMMLESHESLLLAAITAASTYYPGLQQALAEEFHNRITSHALTADGANLDLLQGILVYLAWAQFHMTPRSQQAYKILHIAISISVELGLDDDSASFSIKRKDVYLANGEVNRNGDQCLRLRPEACRASLGCFYISRIISSSTGKPNPLPLKTFVVERAHTMSQVAEFQSDTLLSPLIEYEGMLEDMRALYRSEEIIASGSSLSAAVERMTARLSTWESTVPNELWFQELFTNRRHYARARTYEMGLICRFPKDRRSLTTTETSNEWELLVANLVQCVDAIKMYIDGFLAISTSEYEHIPMEEWYRLMMMLFALYKLSVGPKDLPAWNVHECRQRIDLESYLGQIIRRLRPSGHTEILEDASDDLYHVLPELLESVKASYIVSRDWPGSITPGARVHMDMSKPFQQSRNDTNHIGGLLTDAPRRGGCPAFRFWNTKGLDLGTVSGWHDVRPVALSPEEQLAKNDKLWSELMSNEDDGFA
ncbi:hypothetical protein Q7P37_004790 [Cladosporium fusiforme]